MSWLKRSKIFQGITVASCQGLVTFFILSYNILAISIIRICAAEDHRPSILSTSREEDLEVNIGEQLRWCVSGGSLGVHDLQWAWSQNSSLETVNITANVSDPPCLNCECAQSAYYDLDIVQRYLRNMSMGGARGVAFSVLGYEVPFAMFAKSWQCSGVPTNYLSFVIIDEVEPGDNETELMINVTSFTGESMQGDYAIHTCMCFSVYNINVLVCT